MAASPSVRIAVMTPETMVATLGSETEGEVEVVVGRLRWVGAMVVVVW